MLEVHTLQQAKATTPRDYSTSKRVNSIYDDSMIKMRIAEKRMGQLQMNIPSKDKIFAYEEDGGVYEGQRDEHMHKHGFGIKKWADGSLYIGQWENNQANGKGWLFHLEGDIYAGDFVHDKGHGMGTYLHVDNTKYVGEWKNDMQHGKGVETWPDESRYEG